MPPPSQALARHAQAVFDEGARDSSLDRTVEDLASLTRLLAREPRLRKVFADPALPADVKRAVLADLGGGRLDERAVGLLATLAEHQRVPDRKLGDLLMRLVAQGSFTAAGRALARVEDELFRFGDLVEREHALRNALTDPRLPLERKHALVADLLADRTDARTNALVALLLDLSEGRDLGRLARELAEQAAARRNRVIAEVRTAVELDEARRERLAETLGRITGKQVELRTLLDESILGSVIVRIGDEVFDGSVRRRLELAREVLGVASPHP